MPRCGPGEPDVVSGFFSRHIFRQSTVKSIELLAPAKDLQAAVAAVDYGADALYIGGARFGARQAAGNSAEEIARAVEYAHQYGVRVHATLNTLLYDGELAEAERQARELIAAGVDALIVQDMALRRMNLPVELHASTQVGHTYAGAGAFSGALRLCPRDSGARPCRSTRSVRSAPPAAVESGVFRPRGDLRGVQRPLFPVAFDERAQR